MTIDEGTFEMTVEVLGSLKELKAFFESYERETRADLQNMRKHCERQHWEELRRIAHTWTGRSAQIGFRKCSHLSADLHDFLKRVASCDNDSATAAVAERKPEDEMDSEEVDLVKRQVSIFLEMIEKECVVITDHLQSKGYL